jgi:hypothetical protein
MSDPWIRQMLEAVVEATGWTEQEARTFVGAVRAETPEELFEHAPLIIEIAAKAERMAALIDLIKQGLVLVRLVDGELNVQLPPDTVVEKVATGLRVTIKPEVAA